LIRLKGIARFLGQDRSNLRHMVMPKPGLLLVLLSVVVALLARNVAWSRAVVPYAAPQSQAAVVSDAEHCREEREARIRLPHSTDETGCRLACDIGAMPALSVAPTMTVQRHVPVRVGILPELLLADTPPPDLPPPR
jgi:hypothetical protein